MSRVQDHSAHVATWVRAMNLERLVALRDEFVQLASNGRFESAAAKEWRTLPRTWRMTLLLVAGLGVDTDDLDTLAVRDWQEMPEPEQREVRYVVREARRVLGQLTALAAQV